MGDLRFRVTGEVENRTMLGGVPILYIPLHDAQSLAFGGRPLVTAVVTQGVPAQVPPGCVADRPTGREPNTLSALSAADLVDQQLEVAHVGGGVIIIAALLYVSALQRVRDFAVLKALGSSSMVLLGQPGTPGGGRDADGRGFAADHRNFMGGIFSQPVDIPASAFATLPLVAMIVGLLSSLVALRRATGADPAAAFG